MIKINKTYAFILLGLVIVLSISAISSISVKAQNENVTACCEMTTSGLYCQNAQADQCSNNINPTTNQKYRQTLSGCSSTSFCKPGVCYDSSSGDCAANTPQIACNAANGTWSASSPAACNLGCCVLGDQAAFVSLVKCKRLSAFLGLQTNYDTNIANEVSCILSVQSQETGACVYVHDYETTCTFTTKAVCDAGLNGTTNTTFYNGKLCSDPQLGTNCGRTTSTICLPGKDEIYFKDTCGNPANIYDSTKINDINYWTNVYAKTESCNSNSANSNSKSCGNCNYLLGSFCRNSKDAGATASYGNNICADLNCKNTQNGNSYIHGESWCVYNDAGTLNQSDNSVGSGFYKHICINGQEILEPCADYRQEVCIQDTVTTAQGPFYEAGCRVNRWQDCLLQTNAADCTNSDKRDCTWEANWSMSNNNTNGLCLPSTTPGIQFWSGADAQSVCAQGNSQCVVTYEKGILGGEKCVSGCQCLTQQWVNQKLGICNALGDCGSKINWAGDTGYTSGYNVTYGKPHSATSTTSNTATSTSSTAASTVSQGVQSATQLASLANSGSGSSSGSSSSSGSGGSAA